MCHSVRTKRKYIYLLTVGIAVVFNSFGMCDSEPRVDKKYRQYFKHYSDTRSIKEKLLNIVGMTDEDVGRSFALIAGVHYYPNMSQFEQYLKPAKQDIEMLVEYLRDYEFFDEIVVLENQHMNIQNLTFFLQSYFPERLKKFPKSRFLFAYSGHGMNDGRRGYFILNTATKPKDKRNSLNLRIVRTLVDEVVDAGHHVLVLINSCYCGSFLARSFGHHHYIPKHRGAHAITAGGSDELAWHDPAVGGGSVFFEKLIAGLNGHADTYPRTKGDGIITVDELYSYLKQEVQIFTHQKQNPQFGDISRNGSKGGFFFFNRDSSLQLTAMQEYSLESKTTFSIESEKKYREGLVKYFTGDYKEAMDLFMAAADAGNSNAWFNIGYMYDQALGVTQDYIEAYYWYRKAADSGEIAAMYNIGQLYYYGYGIEQDYNEAMFWFHKAAKAGDAPAMYNIGVIYDNGYGVEKDYEEAMSWYLKAAEAGHASAMYNIGVMYDKGYGTEQDYDKAMHWFQKAADGGHASAMYNIGHMYSHGQGVEKDYEEAMNWYRKADSAGDASALYNIGVFYDKGHGVAQDYDEAIRWFQEAADAGDAMAMYVIGLYYEYGKGVEKNMDDAKVWYQKAADAGHEDAKKRLKELENQ